MNGIQVLTDSFGRVHESVHLAVDGLEPEQLNHRGRHHANSISWLAWHLARVQDEHVADVAGSEQIWTAKGWEQRFGLPLGTDETGYGFTSDQVAAVTVDSGDLLTGYLDEVYQRTVDYLSGLSDDDLDRVIDDSYDPPVTLGVRLVSVVSDDLQHAGQAAFARGLL